tara:strand:+ start:6375 stop:6695 length:321 start_codon:yes stop_codon:yes gene_type:complete
MIPINESINFSDKQFKDAFKFINVLTKDLNQLRCASDDKEKIELAVRVQNSLKNLKHFKSAYKSLRQVVKKIEQIDKRWDLIMNSNSGFECLPQLASETLIEFQGE